MSINFNFEDTDFSDYEQADLYKQLNLLLCSQEMNTKEESTNSIGTLSISEHSLENFCFQKVHKLMYGSNASRNYCYIPEQNLLLLILKDTKTVKVFDTIKFRPLYTKTFEKSIYAVRYSKDCRRVFFGGEDSYIEIYNPEKRKTEAISYELFQGDDIEEVVYLKASGTIAVGTKNRKVYILSRDLAVLSKFNISVFRDEPIKDIIDLENGFLLVTRAYFNKKRFSLCNISNGNVSDFPDIEVCFSSSIDIFKEGPQNIITCLANVPGKGSNHAGRFRLVQIIQEADIEDLVVYKVGPQSKEFLDFRKIENSKYFIARFWEGLSLKVAVMTMFNEKIEIIQTITGFSLKMCELNQLEFIRNDFSLLVGSDSSKNICIYKINKK